MATQFVIHGVW